MMDDTMESLQTYATGGIGVFTAYNWESIGGSVLLIASLLLVCLRLYVECRKLRRDIKNDE